MKTLKLIFATFISTLLIATSVHAMPFTLTETQDVKISTHYFSGQLELLKSSYAYITGNERDELGEKIDVGSVFYIGFDLNLDVLFSYNDISLYKTKLDQKYTINTLNIEIKLKDDHYYDPLFGLDLGSDIPAEYGRVDVQLWTDNDHRWIASWEGDSYLNSYEFNRVFNEIDDGQKIRFSYDFNSNSFSGSSSWDGGTDRYIDSLIYENWYNHGEIIVTAGYPEFFANADFIIDSVKIWGDRTPYIYNTVPEPQTILLIGSGLFGIIGFRRKIFEN